jgi:phage terminase large subunit GpA-like protein
MQALEWGATQRYGMRWSKLPDGSPDLSSVRYVCAVNGCEILEHAKPTMLAAGRWIPSNPAATGRVRGFHLSSLYSPLGWLSWSDVVGEWHRAIETSRAGDPALLRVFVNTRLAETYEEDGDRADEHQLRKRAADIPLRVVHWGTCVATMGVDVQGDRLEAYIWSWGRGMERQLVDRQVIYGDPALPETEAGSPWATLTQVRREPLTHASGRTVPLLAVMIDSGGHHTQAVYAYARGHQHAHVYAIKGVSQSGRAILGKPSEQDVNWRGTKLKRGVRLWPIGTDTAKAEIYGRLRTADPGPGYVWLSKHLPSEVFEQLTAERLVTRYHRGHPKLEWVKPAGRRNEALDCAVYALAAAHYMGIERWREHQWAQWEQRVQGRDLFDDAQPPAGPQPQPPPEAAADAPPAQPEVQATDLLSARDDQRPARSRPRAATPRHW